MSRACAAIAVVVGLVATGFAADGALPYTASVISAKAVVRSGAGLEFYETDKLAKGDQVEVHRHDSDGWCAVRPPAGSFSWVPARYVKVGSPQVPANVGGIEKRVASRIGSNLSAARSSVSVYLEPGELVEILEVVEGGSKPWYKIAPPSGEFRWIHRRFLSAEALANVEEAAPRTEDRGARDEGTVAKVAPAEAAPSKVEKKWTSKSATVARPPASEAPAKEAAAPANTKSAAIASAVAKSAQRTDSEKSKSGAAEKTSAEPVKEEPSAPTVVAQLGALNLRLAAEVAHEPIEWQLSPLRDEAKRLLEAAASPDERDRAQLMLERIARFEDLRRRRQSTDGLAAAPADAGNSLTGPSAESAKGEPIEDDPRFDGSGKLISVHSSKPEAPRYALTDDDNRVVMLISPSPGVNLQAHVGNRVGIRGIRGYVPGVDKPHLTAQRVTSLGRH